MLLNPGQVLAEHYRVIGLLGQGGMAAVYCAHDRSLDRLVAIKQLRPDPFASEKAIEQARQQFQREAQILATLDHPNLPRVTDYFERDGVEYLVMDYVEGQTLSEVVDKRGGGLDQDQVLDWADQLLSALDYIHRHGIIHRDVKPSNIRLTPDGRIFLVDFGLVKLFDATNPKTATVMRGLGTPEYAPPEQYDAHLGHTDPRSDVYAMGATLYHLLTGRVPATATQRVADPSKHRPPRAVGARISAGVENAILRALELQRARRFDSAAEMRATLQLARRPRPPDSGLTQRLPRWPILQRGLLTRRVVSIAVIALLVVGSTLWLANGVGSATPTPSPTVTTAPSPTPSPTTATPTATLTPSLTPTQPATQTTESAVLTGETTASPTSTRTPTRTPTATSTRTPTPTPTPTNFPRQPAETFTHTPQPTTVTVAPIPTTPVPLPVTPEPRPTPLPQTSETPAAPDTPPPEPASTP